MMVQDYAWQVTAEGDYVVLLLSAGKFLIKSLETARRGEPLSGLVSSLGPLKDPGFKVESVAPARAKGPDDFKDPKFLERLFQFRALSAIVACGDELEAHRKRGLAADAAWNAAALNIMLTAKSHCAYFMLEKFNQQVDAAARRDASVSAVLRRLAAMYGCSQILDGQQWLGIISAAEAKFLQTAVSQLMEELRPDALALVECFEIPDRVLNSTIGRKDGNVYEALYQAARDSELNKTEVFDGYEQFLRPHLDLEFLANKNKEPLGDVLVDEEGAEEFKGAPLSKPTARL